MTDDELRAAVARLLETNRVRGHDSALGVDYDFVCPSPSHYPFQWFWDSCFHAIALTHIDLQRAQGEIACLLHAARPDGFIPHMLLWDRAARERALAEYNLPALCGWTTDTPQPPVLGTTLLRLRDAGADAGFLRSASAAALRLYDWWERERDPDRDGLVSILQPDESGLDASPKYDAPLRLAEPTVAGLCAAMDRLFSAYAPVRGNQRAMAATGAFDVEDVLLNAVYAQGRRDLARVLDALGRHGDAVLSRAAASRTEAALLAGCWDEAAGAFFDIWRTPSGEDRPLRVLTITSLLPLWLERLPRAIAARLAAQIQNEMTFEAPYPVPSGALNEPTYAPGVGLLWRGPTWLNTNWFLVHGLRRHGFADLAERIAAASRVLVARSGFREYYHPHTGEGSGAQNFGWSSLVIDM